MCSIGKVHHSKLSCLVARCFRAFHSLTALLFLLAWFGSPHAGADAAIKLEAATISVTGSKFSGTVAGGDLAKDWTRVNFTQTFARIPYVFTVPTQQGSQAGAHRIRNVSTSGFYIRSVEPHTFDGAHAGMQVTYLAVESCADGQSQCEVNVPLAEGGVERWMIGQVDTSRWVGWGRNADDDAYWQHIGFSAASPFTVTPAVLAQIQSLANETGLSKLLPQSRPWLTSAVKDVSSGGFAVALERSEATDKDKVASSERIAWLAAPPSGRKNLLDANGLPVGYEIIRSGAVIKGWDNGSVFVNFAKTWSVNPQVIASLNSRNNREPVAAAGDKGDGGWLRRDSADKSLKSRSGFVVDETHHRNKGQDNNRTRNSGEIAGIFAFERAFSIDPIALDHYRIVHDGSGQTCAPESITVKACADASCSSLYTGAVTLSLSPDASDTNATWSGVGVNGDSVSFSTGQATLNLVYGKAGTVSLDAVGTPITPKPSQCEINGVTGNCSLVMSQCTIRPFEACDVSTSPCTENGVNLYTKINGNGAVVLNLIKIQTAGADKGKLDKNFATGAGKTVSVDLVTGSASLDAATGCPGGMQTLAGSAIGNVSFANGRANNVTVLPAASNSRAVKDVRLRYVLNQSGSQTTSCSTDGFTIRPAYLAVTGIGVASGKTLPGAAGPSLSAGDTFSLEAQARTASAAVSPGYDGVPVLDVGGVQSCMADSAGTDSGDCPGPQDSDRLAGSFGAADPNTGKAGGSFSFDEAGAFRLLEDALIDTGFAAGDAGNQGCVVGDTSNIAGVDVDEPEYGKVGCSIGSQASGAGSQAQFGRFHPAWFTLDSGAINAACSSFSYFGQNFGLNAVISARNQGGTKILTRYPGGGLELAAVRNSEPTTALHPATVFSGDSEPGWVDGKVAIAWNQVQYAKPASLQAPISDLQLGLRVLDADNRPMQAPDLFGQYRLITGYAPELRFGRLRLSYAAGMEALPLSMPLTAQYWNGQVFTRNLADNCTTLTAPILTFFAQTADNQLSSGNTSASFNATLVDGDANLRLSAPGAGKFGLLDLSFGVADWLKYDWDGVDQGADGFPFDDDPRARASFGKSKVQRKGGEKVIIRREVF
jgi:MSHA biogenesis protein MshQ